MIERHRGLGLLHYDFAPIANLLLARCVSAGIMVMVVETWRSAEAHAEDLRNGRSWTKLSVHQYFETQRIGGKLLELPASLAIDLAPYKQYELHGPDKLQWDGDDPVWAELGDIGESLGLKWGGRYKTVPPDKAHFQAPWS